MGAWVGNEWERTGIQLGGVANAQVPSLGKNRGLSQLGESQENFGCLSLKLSEDTQVIRLLLLP